MTTKKIEPGIYSDISNEDYHASDGVSRSGISLLLKAPELYYKRFKKEQTPAMLIGSAFHKRVLEPSKYAEEFVVAPQIDKRSKEGKNQWQLFQDQNEGKSVLSVDDDAKVKSMSESIMNHPIAGEIFGYPGQAEISVYAEHEYTGALVKVRPDWLQENIVVDLKSTSDASLDDFSRSCWNFDYYIQSGMYLSVCNLQGLKVDTFMFVCCENKEPYSVAVYVASRDMIDLGAQRYHEGMAIYKECRDADAWPGLNDNKIETIDLPAWAYKKLNGGGY